MGEKEISIIIFFNPHTRLCLLIFLERRGGERERGRKREKYQLVASPVHRLRTEPKTFLEYRTMLQTSAPPGWLRNEYFYLPTACLHKIYIHDLIPHKKLTKWIFFPDKESEDQRLFTWSHTATLWLWGLSFHYMPWPSLPRSSWASKHW